MQSKSLPSAVNFEELVLGAMLVDSSSTDEVFMLIKEESVFSVLENQLVFRAIDALYQTGKPVDIATVTQQLTSVGDLEKAGGMFKVIELTEKVSSSAHAEYHCQILLQQYIKRLVILFNAKITALAYDEKTDVFDLLSRWQKEFDKVVDVTNKGRTTISFPDALLNLKKEVEILSNNTEDVSMIGIPTGFKRINKHTGGYRKQDLIILAARPGMGKTAKVLKTVVENVKLDNPVGFVSLEMSIHQLTARVVAIDTDFHLKQLLKTGFEKNSYFNRYDEHYERMKDYKLFVDDSGNNDITDIVLIAKLWKRVFGIKLLVVDYLQLMSDKSVRGNREQEISSISRRLKLLAKELEIPVIALSQLSRSVETRGGSKRPLLSDLRESGSIEQDADIVEFIYRPDYYGLEMLEDDYEDATHKECIRLGANTEIIIAKYRGGSTGIPLVKWIGDKTKFIDVGDVNDRVDYIDYKVNPVSVSDAFSDDETTVFDA